MSEPTAAQRIRAEAREASRRALLEAGLVEAIERGGLERPSIDVICARAGYTRGAFYVHFRDRDHFEAEMFEWVLSDILRSLWTNAFEGAADIREIVTRFTDTMARRDWPDLHGDIRAGYFAVLRSIVGGGTAVKERHARLMREVAELLANGIRAGQTSGELNPGVDAERTAEMILLTAIGAIVWDDLGMDLNVRAIGAELNRLLQRGSAE